MRNGSKQNPRWCVRKMDATASDYREVILTVIAREYGPMRHSAKILAKHAQTSYRTAEAWVSGRNVPSGKSLVNIMANCKAMADEMNRLISESRQSPGE